MRVERGRRRLAAFLALLGLVIAPLAVPTAASAAVGHNTQFVIGTGSEPDVAVAPNGTAHVVWVHASLPGVLDQVQYCRVPRGKRACSGLTTFQLPEQEVLSRPYVFLPGGSTVLILAHRCCLGLSEGPYLDESFLLRSDDGGVTWHPPVLVGTQPTSGDAVLGPDGTVYSIDDIVTAGVSVQRAALDGSAVPAPADQASLGTDEYGGTLAVLPDGSVLASHWDGSYGKESMHVARFSGTGDPNVAASWPTVFTSAATSPKTGGEYTQLATGKKGTFLFSEDNEVNARFDIRRWNGTTFGAPAVITPAGQDNIFPTFWADASGRTSLAYLNGARELAYRSSDRSGFATEVVLPSGDAYHLRGATAADGGGFVAYDGNDYNGKVSLVPVPVRRVITETVHKGVVSGKVVPFKTQQPVVLQKATTKGWVAVATHKLNAKGAYSFTSPKTVGRYRVAAPVVEGYGEADGKAITVAAK